MNAPRFEVFTITDDRDQIVDAAVSDYCKTAEELAGFLQGTKRALESLSDQTASWVLLERQERVVQLTTRLAHDYLNASDLLREVVE